MNYYKQLGKNRKKEELPSFLVGLTDAPEDITFAPRPNPSLHYLGPIFVGLCTNYQHHAPPHSLKLGSFHHPQFTMLPGADDISKLLYPQTKADKITQTVNLSKRGVKRPRLFHDIYPHKCTGSKKMFIPDITPHIIDLGKTESIIEGEASLEIPLARTQNVPFRFRRKSMAKRDSEVITLSDIREERRKYFSYKERIAHAHFPKEFTTVRVIGPTIPASITITKLPSKRRTASQLTLELKSETQKVETEKSRRKSIRSKSGSVYSSKKFPTKTVGQDSENLEEAEKEIETRAEVYDEARSIREEEEFDGEGAEDIAEEVEGEKEEIDEEEEEEEDEEEDGVKPEDREERKTVVKEERKTIVKEEPKAEDREGRKTIVKEGEREGRRTIVKEGEREGRRTIVKEGEREGRRTIVKEGEREGRKTIVKEEPRAEEREGRRTIVKEGEREGRRTIVKEEPKAEEREGRKTIVKEEPKAEEREGRKTIVIEEPRAEDGEGRKTIVKEEKVKSVQIKQEPESEEFGRRSNVTEGRGDIEADRRSNTSAQG